MAKITVQDPSVVIEQKVPFTFSSGSLVLQQVMAGSIIDTAWVRIDVPFDDPNAVITMGTSSDPQLVFELGDIMPSVIDQYTSQAFAEISLADILSLVISPASSTQGAGLLVYRYRR